MKHVPQSTTHHWRSLLLIAFAAGIAFAAEPAPKISKGELKELIASARTTEDHHRLAIYFKEKADMMEKEAVEHEELAQVYFDNPGNDEMKRSWSVTTAGHCRTYAKEARKAEAEDRALATAHETMAKAASR